MKLTAIHFLLQRRILGLGNRTEIHFGEPGPGRNVMPGWSVHVRGPAVFLISPRGWKHGVDQDGWNKDGDATVFEFPRNSVDLQWSGEAGEIENVQKWSAPGEPSDDELERLTQPKKGK